jgi:hypothetical protein
MNKVLQYIIQALDNTGPGTKSAEANAKATSQGLMQNMANIKAAWDMAAGAVIATAQKMWSAVQESFKFETLTTQFSVLMGDMGKAKDRMAELGEFAAKTPFKLEETVVASRQLHVFSNGALGAMGSLKMVGDAAAAVGGNIQEVSFWVGRAYSMIAGGKPFGEAAMRLQELGIITPEVRTKMEELQAAGATNAEVWAVLEGRLGTFKGGMEQLSKTGDGLKSTMEDNWTAVVRTFGDAFQSTAKDGIKALSDQLDNLVKNGDVAVWASKAVRAFEDVKATASGLATVVGWAGKALKFGYEKGGVSDFVGGVRGFSRAAGALSTGDFSGAGTAFLSGIATGHYGGRALKAVGDPGGGVAMNDAWVKADAEREAGVRAKAISDAQSKKDPAKAAEDEKAKLTKALAAEQAATDERKKKELLAKEAEERAKLEKKAEEDRIKAAEKVAEAQRKANEAAIKDERDARIEAARDAAKAGSDEERAGQDRLQKAKAAAEQAWGWYRDPASFKKQLEEEKAQKAAEKQFEKDADRLSRRGDWRSTTRLSDSEEAVRRVVLAREEQKAAERALLAIEKNTAGLEAMLKELLSSK